MLLAPSYSCHLRDSICRPHFSKEKRTASERFSAFCLATHNLFMYSGTIFMVLGEDADWRLLCLIKRHPMSCRNWEKKCFKYQDFAVEGSINQDLSTMFPSAVPSPCSALCSCPLWPDLNSWHSYFSVTLVQHIENYQQTLLLPRTATVVWKYSTLLLENILNVINV